MSTLVERVLEEFYTYAETAKALGISKVALWRRVKKGFLVPHKLGREALFEKAEVERLKAGR